MPSSVIFNDADSLARLSEKARDDPIKTHLSFIVCRQW